MTNDPMNRFDKLLKAMVEGEPPIRKTPSSDKEAKEAPNETNRRG